MEPTRSVQPLPMTRESADRVARHHRLVQQNKLLLSLLDAIPVGMLITNDERQIIYANRFFRDLVNGQELPLSLLPGEFLNCRHAVFSTGGCGTTESCSYCGLNESLLAKSPQQQQPKEAFITRQTPEGPVAMNLRVTVKPLPELGERLQLVIAMDVSDEKRRQVLEQTFFHDLSNTASLIHGLVDLLNEPGQAKDEEDELLADMLSSASRRLTGEIDAQKQVAEAETGALDLRRKGVETRVIIEEIVRSFRHHEVATDRLLIVDEATENVVINSDQALLGRVLGNMVKNALEASKPGQRVTVGCRRAGGEVHFWVHNPTSMPPDVKAQVFQRHYTTKGRGRGLGTYSMRLLAERYLNGRVTFSSDATRGTTFIASFPAAPLNGYHKQE